MLEGFFFQKIAEETTYGPTRLFKTKVHIAGKSPEMASASGAKYAYRSLYANGIRCSKNLAGQVSQQWRLQAMRRMASMSAESQHKASANIGYVATLAYVLAATLEKSRRSGSNDVRDRPEGLLDLDSPELRFGASLTPGHIGETAAEALHKSDSF